MRTLSSKNFTTIGITKCDDRKIIAIDNGVSIISFIFKNDKQIEKLIKTLKELKSNNNEK